MEWRPAGRCVCLC